MASSRGSDSKIRASAKGEWCEEKEMDRTTYPKYSQRELHISFRELCSGVWLAQESNSVYIRKGEKSTCTYDHFSCRVFLLYLVYFVHFIRSLFQFSVLLQRLCHMFQGTVQEAHGLRPFLGGHVWFCHVVAAESLEGEYAGGGLLLLAQVLSDASNISQISHMLSKRRTKLERGHWMHTTTLLLLLLLQSF